jgi:hypothetical protein
MSDPRNELEAMVDGARLCICGHPKHEHNFPNRSGECNLLDCDCKKFEQKIFTATVYFGKDADLEIVNHPTHYGGGDNPYEHIKVCDAWGLNYRLGNATKYICRAGKKTPDTLTDLKKALWYIQSEIERLEREQ